jgi:hypothetical protein
VACRPAENARMGNRGRGSVELQVGDRLSDETGDWEVIGRPYTTAGGKDARVRVQRMGKPSDTEIRIWRARERVSVRPVTAEEEGKP